MPRTRQKLATLDAVEEIARRVPGYKGYQELSQRREDDRRFRNSIAEHLAGEAHRLERIESHQFRDDFSDLLEEVDAGARKLEFLADAIGMPSPAQKSTFTDDAAESAGQIDRQILEELDQLPSRRPRAGEGLRSRRAFRDEPGRAARADRIARRSDRAAERRADPLVRPARAAEGGPLFREAPRLSSGEPPCILGLRLLIRSIRGIPFP